MEMLVFQQLFTLFKACCAIRINQLSVSDTRVSISPTFYEQLLCQNPFAKKLQTQIVST
jgi:hypothetical protein